MACSFPHGARHLAGRPDRQSHSNYSRYLTSQVVHWSFLMGQTVYTPCVLKSLPEIFSNGHQWLIGNPAPTEMMLGDKLGEARAVFVLS